MDQETFVVGGREFTAVRMNAFAANKLLIRVQKIVVPVFGALAGTGKDLGDIDVREAAQLIATNLDESMMDSIIFPLFTESKLFCTDAKKFLRTGVDIDQCFTTATLFDLYELIFVLARYQFGPFFTSLVDRFGSLTGEENSTEPTAGR